MLARKEWGPVPPVVKEVVDSVIRVLLVEHWGPMINDAFERGGGLGLARHTDLMNGRPALLLPSVCSQLQADVTSCHAAETGSRSGIRKCCRLPVRSRAAGLNVLGVQCWHWHIEATHTGTLPRAHRYS